MVVDKLKIEDNYMVTVGDEKFVEIEGVTYKITIPSAPNMLRLAPAFTIIKGASVPALEITSEQIDWAIKMLFIDSKYVQVINAGTKKYGSIASIEKLPQKSYKNLLGLVDYFEYAIVGGENPCELEDPKKKEP